MSGPSEPVRDVLVCIGDRYRAARRTAWLVAPFGGFVGYAMRDLRGPSFTAYPAMLGHERSLAAFDNPDGDGLWIGVIGEAQDLFAERERYELWHVFRAERDAKACWWTAFAVSSVATISFFAVGLDFLSFVFLCVSFGMAALSLVGISVASGIAHRTARNTDFVFKSMTGALPGKLWAVIDGMRDTANPLEKAPA